MRRFWLLCCISWVSAIVAWGQAKRAMEPSWQNLKYPQLRSIQWTAPVFSTLPNGLRLALLEKRDSPLIQGIALVRTGTAFDPVEKLGLAAYTFRSMILAGAGQRTGDDVVRQLAQLAATVDASMDTTAGRITFSTVPANAGAMLELVRDFISSPRFEESGLDAVREEFRRDIEHRADDAVDLASAELRRFVFGDAHPEGRQYGFAQLQRIDREDVMAFHRRYFFPANVVIAMVGDFEASAMKQRLESLFGEWQSSQDAVGLPPHVEPKPSPGVYFSERRSLDQTEFRAGHISTRQDDPDNAALEVMAQVLGGGIRSRLYQKLVVRDAYVSAISADWKPGPQDVGIFEIAGRGRGPAITSIMQAILTAIEEISTNPVPDRELADAKERAGEKFIFEFDTTSQALTKLLLADYYGYGKDWIADSTAAISKVTSADVLRVAKKHLMPDQLVFFALGSPSGIAPPLSSLGRPVKKLDLQPEEYKVQVTPESLQKGREWLQRLQQAMGGVDALKAVHDLEITSEAQLSAYAGGSRIPQVLRWSREGLIRQQMKIPLGTVTSFCDGSGGWIQVDSRSQAMVGQPLRQARLEIFRNLISLALSDQYPDRTVNYAGGGVLEISDKTNRQVQLKVDPSNGLPRYQIYELNGSQVRDDYREFEPLGGLMLPRRVITSDGGREYATTTISGIKLNTGVSREELSKRP